MIFNNLGRYIIYNCIWWNIFGYDSICCDYCVFIECYILYNYGMRVNLVIIVNDGIICWNKIMCIKGKG